MRPNGYSIYLVDDDESVRDSLGITLGLRGYSVTMFADAESFLKVVQPDWRGCMLLDIRMPGMDGLTLQKRLKERGFQMQVIVMSGHGSLESVREAFRAQAVDFLEKPIDQARLMQAIDEAFARESDAQVKENRRSDFERLLESLTPRESEIMEYVVAGRHNREIAETLGISARTVEVHKARLMAKLDVDGVPDLVRFSLVSQNKFTD